MSRSCNVIYISFVAFCFFTCWFFVLCSLLLYIVVISCILLLWRCKKYILFHSIQLQSLPMLKNIILQCFLYFSAVDIIKRINSSNLKLQLDIFHMQHICGDLTHNIKDLMPYVGHVQVIQFLRMRHCCKVYLDIE